VTTADKTKTRETRLRRMAKRQGLVLRKSPRRDWRAFDYDMWNIETIEDDRRIAESEGALLRDYSMTLDDVEEYLNQPGRRGG
jgi:hypothetical protein